jgi:hypothetical protein
MGLKRSLISQEKSRELQQEHAVYIISCGLHDCPCGRTEPGCDRGFFSLFIQAVYGIAFAQKNNMPYHINFGNCEYLYSDPARKSLNFWDYYFLQPLPQLGKRNKPVLNYHIEVYPLRIWNQQHFLHMHQNVVSRLKFREEVKRKLKKHAEVFKNRQVLGVQIRRTDHSGEILPVSLKRILEKVDQKIPDYDNLFVATDDSHIISLLQKRYGEKLLYHSAERSEDEQAVHLNRGIEDRYKLGLEVLVDCYCLSLCRHAILLQSNISYATLLFNPHLPYTLLERAAVKGKRLKTLFLYYLDKFGIRKW